MRNIMLSSPNYFTRVPDQSFIVSSTGESNDRSEAGDALISGTRAQGWAMVHLPHGGEVEVDLVRALDPSGSWKACWVDTKCGERSGFDSGNFGSRTRKFVAPKRLDKSQDWLLLLEHVSLSSPDVV
jgi:hypothetical protein